LAVNPLRFVEYGKRKDIKNRIKNKIDEETKNLDLEKRREYIKTENDKLSIELNWLNNEIAIAEYWKKQKEIENEKFLKKIREERLIKENIEQEKKLKEEKRLQEIYEKKELEEKEEQLRLERIKNEELKQRKILKRENDYKEIVKRNLLEKERKKHLESEAIQELIQKGLINENFSSQFNRASIPSYVKEIVWNRDKQRCVNCMSTDNLEFDHIIPVSKGGSNSVNNIQLLCLTCNRRKSNKIH